MQQDSNSTQVRAKTGPRGGKHSPEACNKMRAAWAERKRLLELGRRADSEATAKEHQSADD